MMNSDSFTDSRTPKMTLSKFFSLTIQHRIVKINPMAVFFGQKRSKQKTDLNPNLIGKQLEAPRFASGSFGPFQLLLQD